ncbi:MAG: hypothetical protein OEZ65_15795 [Gemmatimonadota bacterium]|nr:hypothetical protein [Gemmatimonadota bacterium]MDH5761027.1 hypothetical protein [Gemmatimonadota bacterium]
MLDTIRERWRGLLLEGIAVLLGVLLAFAVDSYGEERSERRSEAAYLGALAEELLANDLLLDSLMEASRQRISTVERYLGEVVHAPAGRAEAASSVNEMLGMVGPFRVAAFQRGALDDLLTSGGIELVRSGETRRGILLYAQLMSQERVRQEAALRYWEDQMAPYYYEHASFFDFMTWEEFEMEALPDALDPGAFHRSTQYSNLLLERRVRDQSLMDTRCTLADQIDALRQLLTDGSG